MNLEEIKGATILVVDDSPTNLLVLFNYSKQMGLNVLVAKSGEDALEQVAYGQPDIILLDILMPGLDGFETCRRLKANALTRDIPVIFMTALNDSKDIVAGFELGAIDYITKPFHHEEVLARISTHLTVRHQQLKLHKLNATQNKFFTLVGHDLKEVLSTLVSLSNFLVMSVSGQSNQNLEQVAKMVEGSVQNAIKFLENLLNWARIQNGTLEFQPESIDLQKLVLENIVLLRSHARKKQIRLSHAIEANTVVYTDPNVANMILRNLISNALWFTETGGEVTIAAAIAEPFVEIAVADTGVGIEAEDLPKLFRIDKRFRRNGTAGEHGTGLGLILCKNLVEMNGGRIGVNSEVAHGSTFTFTLPRRKLLSEEKI